LSEIGAANENVPKTVDQYPHKGIDTLDESLEIVPVTTPLNGSVRPPGSKSLTNRALICAALANGSSTLSGALDSEDTQVMVSGLQSLGISIAADWAAATLKVDGCAGLVPARKAALNLEGSGTSIRFLTALTATGKGLFTLDGNERMRQRPIGELTDALRKCHTDIESQGGFPPVMVRANRRREVAWKKWKPANRSPPLPQGFQIVLASPLRSNEIHRVEVAIHWHVL